MANPRTRTGLYYPPKGSAEAKRRMAYLRSLRGKKNPLTKKETRELLKYAGSNAAMAYRTPRSAKAPRLGLLYPGTKRAYFAGSSDAATDIAWRHGKVKQLKYPFTGDVMSRLEEQYPYLKNPTSRARYIHKRLVSPRRFDPRSFRIVDPGRPGHTKLIVGCPRGYWDAKRGRCRVGTRAQAILREKKNPYRGDKRVLIYDRTIGPQTLRAVKPASSNYPREQFQHIFRSPMKVYGLPDGSVQLVGARGQKLWKYFPART